MATKKTAKKPVKKVTGKKESVKKTPSKKNQSIQIPAFLQQIRKTNPQKIKKTIVDHKKAAISILVVILLLILILPHLAIAWVDNKPITIFEYYKDLDSKYGTQEKQQLVSERLVEDEASNRGIIVSDAQVNSDFQQAVTQASGSANLDQLLSQQGLNETDFRQQLRLQDLIKKMFAQQATVSSQEVDQYIVQNQDQFPTVDAATKQQVEQQLSQQKLISAFQSWLQMAQQSSRVKGL